MGDCDQLDEHEAGRGRRAHCLLLGMAGLMIVPDE